jgi:hypothetical protein
MLVCIMQVLLEAVDKQARQVGEVLRVGLAVAPRQAGLQLVGGDAMARGGDLAWVFGAGRGSS